MNCLPPRRGERPHSHSLHLACLYFSGFQQSKDDVFSKHVEREFNYHDKMLKVQLATKSRSSSKFPQLSIAVHEVMNPVVTLCSQLPRLMRKFKHILRSSRYKDLCNLEHEG